MTRSRAFAAIAAAYLVACGITVVTSGHPLRPLYEGVGPAQPYRWVNPPADFRSTNKAPFPITLTINLTPTGSPATGVSSGDGQLILSMPTGAVPASRSSPSVVLAINPVDPAHLGGLPAGLYADGNVYQVTVTYQPGKRALAEAARKVDAVLVTPVPSFTVLQSPDGATWTRGPIHHIPKFSGVSTSFTRFGYLLAAADHPVVVKPPGSSSLVVPIVLGCVAAAMGLAAALLARRRRHPHPD